MDKKTEKDITKKVIKEFPLSSILFADISDRELDRWLDIIIDIKNIEGE